MLTRSELIDEAMHAYLALGGTCESARTILDAVLDVVEPLIREDESEFWRSMLVAYDLAQDSVDHELDVAEDAVSRLTTAIAEDAKVIAGLRLELSKKKERP